MVDDNVNKIVIQLSQDIIWRLLYMIMLVK